MSQHSIRIRVAAAMAAAVAMALVGCSAAADDQSSGGDGDASLPTIRSGALTICTTDSPPNIVVDADGELVGIEIDIAEALAEQLDLDVEYMEYAFAGLLPALQAQQCDVIMGSLYVKPEREEIADFVPYLLSGSAVGVAAENEAGITGFDSTLCGTRVAVITGTTGASLTEERSSECESEGEEAIDVTLVDEGVNALQQVQAGQVDALIDTAEMITYYQQQTDDEFEIVGDPFGTIAIGAATLRGDDTLHLALEDAFAAIVEDGTYEQILGDNGAEVQDIRNASAE